MNVSEFDFELPDALIAQHPPPERGGSRLLVLRRDGGIEHVMFSELGRYLVSGDLLVVNNTRVFPARLLGHRVPSGGAVECLLLTREPTDPRSPIPDPGAQTWQALVHPGQKLKPCARMVFERCDNNKRQACRELGISYHTLQAYLRFRPDYVAGLPPAKQAGAGRADDPQRCAPGSQAGGVQW